jgi:hypothetical protein
MLWTLAALLTALWLLAAAAGDTSLGVLRHGLLVGAALAVFVRLLTGPRRDA